MRFTGGTVIGGVGQEDDGGIGAVFDTGENVILSGTTFIGGASIGEDGGTGVNLEDGDVIISGGVFKGGAGTEDGGNGLATGDAKATISGGTFTGGKGDEKGGIAAFFDDSRSVIEITGGSFVGGEGGPKVTFASTGGAVVRANDNAEVFISGGTFQGGIGGTAALEVFDSFFNDLVSVSGGDFTGSFDNDGVQREAVYASDGAAVEFLGGTFNVSSVALLSAGPAASPAPQTVAMVVEDDSTVDLRGGTFGGVIELYDTAQLNVFGARLKFENGRLTGILQDQSEISIEILINESASVNLTATPVPVPATLPLMAVGVGALMAWRRHCYRVLPRKLSRVSTTRWTSEGKASLS